MGYTNQLGEFTFTSVSSEGLVPRANLYLDLLNIALNSADVKRLILVPFIDDYGAKLMEVLDEYLRNADTENSKDCFFSIWMNLRIPLVANGIYWVTP